MSQPRASEVSMILNQSDWKVIQSLLHSVAQQQQDAGKKAWAEQIIRKIEEAKLEASRLNKKRVSFMLKSSDWRAIQTFLRPADNILKKDKLKERKQKTIGMIRAAVDAARQRIIVTTGDLERSYEVIGPVYFQVSNKGIFSNHLSKLVNQYKAEIARMKQQGLMGVPSADWGFLIGEFSVGQSAFEQAFFIAVQELKKRAQILDADAIIAMRQDIDLDTNAFQYFYLQMYGTAVKFRPDTNTQNNE